MNKLFTWALLALFCMASLTACNRDHDMGVQPESQLVSKNTTPRLYAIKQVGVATKAVSVKGKTWEPGATIRIKFLNGSGAIQSKVQQYAALWLEHANVKFEYVATSQEADVKIGFEWGNEDDLPFIAWSTTGTDARLVPQTEASLNFVGLEDDLSDEAFIKGEVLQAFGRILGLGFEHQAPQSPIVFKASSNTDLRKLEGHFGMSREQIMEQIIPLYTEAQSNHTEYDNTSIMCLALPGTILTNPKLGVDGNTELSELDKTFIAQLYPPALLGEWGDYTHKYPNAKLSQTSLTTGKFVYSCKGKDGKAYFASSDRGIWRLEDSGEFTQVNTASYFYRFMELGPDGYIYLGGTSVLKLTDDYQLKPVAPQPLNTTWKNNVLYFGTYDGLYKCDASGKITKCNNYGGIHFLTVGQDGAFYTGSSCSADPLWRFTETGARSAAVPAGIAHWAEGLVGQDNKTYFRSTNSEVGIWRLDDDGVVRPTNVALGRFSYMFKGADDRLYFTVNGSSSIGWSFGTLEDDGNISFYLYKPGYYAATLGKDNRLYLFGNNSILVALPGGHIQEVYFNNQVYMNHSGAQLGQDGSIYLYNAGTSTGIRKFSYDEGETLYATSLTMGDEKYYLMDNDFGSHYIRDMYRLLRDGDVSYTQFIKHFLTTYMGIVSNYRNIETSNSPMIPNPNK